jgi:XisH protein
MPRKDLIHESVRNALVKDGWTITDDPFRIAYEDANVYADLRIMRTATGADG